MGKSLVFWMISSIWILKIRTKKGRRIKDKIEKCLTRQPQQFLLSEEKIVLENATSKSNTITSVEITLLNFIIRIDKNLDGSQTGKLKDSTRDIADSDLDKDNVKSNSQSAPKDPPPILKYIKTQVQELEICSL